MIGQRSRFAPTDVGKILGPKMEDHRAPLDRVPDGDSWPLRPRAMQRFCSASSMTGTSPPAAAIIEAAGGRGDRPLWGEPFKHSISANLAHARRSAASGAALHPLLIERTTACFPIRAKQIEPMSDQPRQLLHLVIGGELKDLDRPEFIDLSKLSISSEPIRIIAPPTMRGRALPNAPSIMRACAISSFTPIACSIPSTDH